MVTITNADNSYTITTNQYGRTISEASFDASGNPISGLAYGYDPHGRPNTIMVGE